MKIKIPMIPRSADLRILSIMDMRDGDGMTAKAIGDRHGMSKSAVLGVIHRINRDAHPCACEKPQNRDGGMSRRWWA